MTQTHEDRLLGMQFGSYRLQRLIAAGGMARIYEAEDVVLNRAVAVKVLNLEGNPDTTMAVRFQREAKAVAKLDHDPATAHLVSHGTRSTRSSEGIKNKITCNRC